MGELQSNLSFRLMSLGFRLRDLRLPRGEILKEVGIKTGFTVLDYGCGAGSYVPGLSELVGPSGKVYALDIHPLAIESVKRLVSKRGLTNVETILSDCRTGLPDASIDVALMYDIYHDLAEPGKVLRESHRVLKPDGILSFNDHHMKHEEVIAKIGGSPFFRLADEGKMTYRFSKTKSP
ncbi:MAG: class I SAM-dependent methyltransferase [Dehalococcoidia bacterium]|nr:class I SAM-dependent methyltransferase [Dehalococcoidia bacterium]